jgi:hypothetical protein
MNRKFYRRRKQNEDTPLQDLHAGVNACHNNYSGFTKVRISIGKGTILTDVYCCGAGETYQIRDATLLRLHQGHVCLFVFLALQPIVVVFSQPGSGLWPPRFRGFLITHNDAPQSVGLLWTSDQSVAEIST